MILIRSIFLLATTITFGSAIAANIDIEQIPDLPIKNIPAASVTEVANVKDSWQISLGGGLSYAPSYEGAANDRLRMMPLLDASYNNGKYFMSPLRGIGWNFSEEKDAQYGTRLSIGRGRDQSVDAHLLGMGNINYVPEAGMFYNRRAGAYYFSGGVSIGSHGAHAEIGTGIGFPLGAADRLRLGINLNWGGNNYNQTYFGITSQQAASSVGQLAAYDASAGVTDYALTTNWIHNYDKKWFSNAGLSIKQIIGGAQQSPLTQRSTAGSANYLLGYRF